jgi:ubiquinone/menaquinone biosynthesis C-methylase UbiE
MYHPEPYWNEVAKNIVKRKGSVIAGDDEPYYRYKREKFLKILNSVNFTNKKVLEVGSGPGGNLFEIIKQNPKELVGLDISDEMVKVSKEFLKDLPVSIIKIDGTHFPFANSYFDISITSTVLQHNTDEIMLKNVIQELCRVSGSEIYIFEKIEAKVKGTSLCMGRPVDYYKFLFDENGFELKEVRFLQITISQVMSGIFRKLFNSSKRKEGEPVTAITKISQKAVLPLTSVADNFLFNKREVAMLHFTKVK